MGLNTLPEHAIDHAALGIRKNARIPEYTTDPASPKVGDVWVLNTGFTSDGNAGEFRMLGIPMLYAGDVAGTQQLSYKSAYGIKRVTIS